MSNNVNFKVARENKNDEFYTRYEDIEKELQHYDLKGKLIYCNCDTAKSNFVKYFQDKGLNFIYSSDDFRSEESIEKLKKADIVITNPPFSLFRQYMQQLVDYDKKFLIIGNMNAIGYKNIYPYIIDGKIRLGINQVKEFITIDGIKKFGNIYWYTNLDYNLEKPFIELTKTYNEADYPEYDNYNAIEVSKVKDIPMDYEGFMGVPVSFLIKHNPKQFKIYDYLHSPFIDKAEKYKRLIIKPTWSGKTDRTYLSGKRMYSRVFIKKCKNVLQ